MLAHIEHLSRLELVWETIRVAYGGLVSDGYWLLGQMRQHGSARLKALPEMALLERVLAEQFEPPGSNRLTVKAQVEGTACGDVIVSVYDTECH